MGRMEIVFLFCKEKPLLPILPRCAQCAILVGHALWFQDVWPKHRLRINVSMIDSYVLYSHAWCSSHRSTLFRQDFVNHVSALLCLFVMRGVAVIEQCFDKSQQHRQTPAPTFFASLVMSVEKKLVMWRKTIAPDPTQVYTVCDSSRTCFVIPGHVCQA